MCSPAVSWQWGSGQPSGEVAEVKEQGEIAIESNRGNTIKKNAEPDNPAVHIERSGNDVVKRASELQIDEKAEGNTGTQSNGDSKEENKDIEGEVQEKADTPADSEKKDADTKDTPASDQNEAEKSESKTENAEAVENDGDVSDTDNKRKVDESAIAETNGKNDDSGEPAAKKAKTDDVEADGEEDTKTKKAGRPKASEKKEKKEPVKKKQPKPAATEDGQPRRSSRNK